LVVERVFVCSNWGLQSLEMHVKYNSVVIIWKSLGLESQHHLTN
jgi:hypothetical protein